MKSVKSILCFTILCMCCGCAEYSSTLPLLKQAEMLMEECPDSALIVLESTSLKQIVRRGDRAKYALLYSQALDKNYIDSDNDSLIRIAVDYYDQHGSTTQKAWALFYQARIYENRGDTDDAMSLFLEAESFAEQTGEYYLIAMLCNRKAHLYAASADYVNAIAMYEKSAQNYERVDMPRNKMYVYDGLARVHLLQGNVSAATHALSTSQNIAEQLADTMMALRCAQYYANILFDEIKDPHAALGVLKKAYNDYQLAYPIELYPLLSDIYLLSGNTSKAYDYAIRYYRSRVFAEQKAGILSQLRMIALAADDNRLYIESNEEYMVITDSLNEARRATDLFQIEQKYNNHYLATENSNLQRHYNLYVIISLLGISLLICTTLILVYFLRRHRKQLNVYKNTLITAHEQFSKLQEIQKEMDSDNVYLVSVLNDKVLMLKEIVEMAGISRGNAQDFLDKFSKYVKEDEKHNLSVVFRDIIETKQSGILTYLKQTYPELSSEDIDLYCLICGGCSIDVLSLIYNNTPKYIYNKRTLLRKKLSLSEDEKRTFPEHLTLLIEDFRGNRLIGQK